MSSRGDVLTQVCDEALERELIGSSFVSLACADVVAGAEDDVVYTPALHRLHQAVRRLVQRGCVPTPALVLDEVHPTEEDRDAWISSIYYCQDSIMVAVPSTVQHMLSRLREYATRRFLRTQCMQALTDLQTSEAPEDIITRMVQQLLSHRTMASTTTLRSIGDIAAEVYDSMGQPFDGVTWGFPRMDAVFGANGSDWLTFIGGRPSSGKTALALNMAYNVARTGRPTLFASLEMSETQAVTRVLSGVSRVPQKNLRERNLDPVHDGIAKIAMACNEVRDVPMYVSAPRASIADIRRDMMRVQQETGQRLGGVYIDRIELLHEVKFAAAERTQQAMSQAATLLQDLAKEMQVPVICLAQLNRKIDDRAGEAKIPKASDFAQSGTIEQVAMVAMMFEHERFEDPNGVQIRNLHVVKNMHGQTGWLPLRFRPYAVTFEEVDDATYSSLRRSRAER